MTIEIGYLESYFDAVKAKYANTCCIKTYKMNVRTYFFSCNAN
jgi:hypothetical protein